MRVRVCVISCTLPYLIIFFFSFLWWHELNDILMHRMRCSKCQCCRTVCCYCCRWFCRLVKLLGTPSSTKTLLLLPSLFHSNRAEDPIWDMSFRWPVRCHRHLCMDMLLLLLLSNIQQTHDVRKRRWDFLFWIHRVLIFMQPLTQPSPYLNRNLFCINEGNTTFFLPWLRCCRSCCSWMLFSLRWDIVHSCEYTHSGNTWPNFLRCT